MKNLKNNKTIYIIIGFIVMFSILSVCINGCKNFFQFNVGNVFTWIIAIYITYLLNQRKTDERKSIDFCYELSSRIYSMISDARFTECYCESDVEFVIMQKEYLSNCMNALFKVKDKFNIKQEVELLKNEFDKYEELFDEHFKDLEKLQNEKNLLKKRINLMKNKCTDITVKLYFGE